MRSAFAGFLVVFLLWSVAGADPYNPQPADGDLVLPLPGGVSMVFRPVFIGEGDTPYALKKIRVGDPEAGFKEHITNVVLGGAFKGERQGKPDWLYYLGKYEVMEDQYYAFMDPSKVSRKDGQYPVQNVSWFEVQEFLHKYNTWLFENARDTLPKIDGWVGYVRLPTESEWEFAARGGAEVSKEQAERKLPYTEELNRYEWFAGPSSSHNKLQKAGQLKPHVLRLHDMLGNVSEMTASHYQIEYYQGRVGGFVARGGNFSTARDTIRSSQRSEQPFYNRELKPQRSETLGFRVLISAVVFTGLQTAKELENAWGAYRSGPGAASPALHSILPPVAQVGVQLAEAVSIVDRLLKDAALAPDHARQIHILRASFANIEASRREAVVDTVLNILELATIRADYVSRGLKKLPSMLGILQSLKGEARQNYQNTYDDFMKDVERWLNLYVTNLQELSKYDEVSIETAMQKYRKQSSDPEKLRVLDEAVRQHVGQFHKEKRVNVEQWKMDLANL